MLTNLEYLKEFVKNGKVAEAEKYPFHYPPAIATTLGFTLAEVGEGSAVIELQVKPEVHGNAMKTLHGGVLCDITDAAIGTAHATTIEPGESYTSVDLQINFFRPVWNEKIRASAKLINGGKTLSRDVCDVTRPDGKLVAQVASTVLTLRGESAKGR